jgi:hypothetical protein
MKDEKVPRKAARSFEVYAEKSEAATAGEDA